ncbi:MAG: hypothetical protein ACJAVI_001072 [Candidatus Azotimanducaceae bacterium]|jgi:hypothetical protein
MQYLADKLYPFYSAALLNMHLMHTVAVLTGFVRVLVLVSIPTCSMAAAGTDPLKINSLHQIYAADPLDITTAEFIEIDVDSPPTSIGTKKAWMPIKLPHLWSHDERERHGSVGIASSWMRNSMKVSRRFTYGDFQ